MATSVKIQEKMVNDWKNDKFESVTLLAKHYGVVTSTASRILTKWTGKTLEETRGANKAIIKMGVDYEKAKHDTKSLTEIKTIEQVVRETTDLKILREEAEKYSIAITVENMRKMGVKIDKGTKQIVVKGGKDMGDSIEDIEFDFNDHKLVQETVDKALITIGSADRHAPKGDINMNQNNNNGTIKYQANLPFPVAENDDDAVEVAILEETA